MKYSVIISLFILSGCYSAKKATKDVIRARTYYPEVVLNFCSQIDPIVPSTHTEIRYLPGQDSLIFDTVTVDCEEVINEIEKIVKVPVIKNHFRVDTFLKRQTDTFVDSRKVNALTIENGDLERNVAVLSSKIETKNKWMWGLGIAAAFLLAALIFTIKMKIF